MNADVKVPSTDEAPQTGGDVDKQLDQLWDRRFEELLAFRADHGHCRVSSKWPQNPPLANWVKRQREHHQEGRLEAERERRLEEIGFVWEPASVAAEEHWEQRLAELEAFHAERGHLRVPKSDPKWGSLGCWLKDQRGCQRRGELAPERKARLEALGIDWEPTLMTAAKTAESPTSRPPSASAVQMAGDPPKNEIGRWEYYYLHLLTFYQGHGHVNVPPDWPENPALAAWVQEQRPGHEYGRLHFDQIVRLEKLGFEWRRTTDETFDDERRPE